VVLVHHPIVLIDATGRREYALCQMATIRFLLCSAFLSVAACCCPAQFPQTIHCTAERAHRDTRHALNDAGNGFAGEEYCVLVLPGSLEVRDGPYLSWQYTNIEGAAGSYKLGREIGEWKECNQFDHCEQKDYPELDPDEKQRSGIKPEIPITYSNGKYVFDFSSCRRTVIEHTEGYVTDLNIGSQQDGCSYHYNTKDDVIYQDDLQAQSGKLKQGFFCTVPFQLGKRAFDTLDLISELPKLGLSQYCTKDSLPPEPPYFVDVNPTGKTGGANVFVATYDTGNNGVGIAQARLHFQKSAASRSDRCVVRYDPGSKSLYLNSDEPGKYLGPIATGGNESLSNKECLLAGCSNAQLSGTTLTVKFAIRFNPDKFSGTHRMYMELVDTQKHATPAGDYGEWTVPVEEAQSPDTQWPSDRSCPVTSPGPQ
jgi:hypothetical protein